MQFKNNLVIDKPQLKIGRRSEMFDAVPGADPIRSDYLAKWYAPTPNGLPSRGFGQWSREDRYSLGSGPKISIWPLNATIFSDTIATTPSADLDVISTIGSLESATPYGKFSETLIIAGDPGAWSHQEWVSHVTNNYAEGSSYADHVHSYNSPYSMREQILGIPVDTPIATAQVRLDYNYYLPSYERTIDYASTATQVLPHLYTFYLDIQRLAEFDGYTPFPETLDQGLYREFITLGQPAMGSLWQSIDRDPHVHDTTGADINYLARTTGRYYNAWSTTYRSVGSFPRVSALQSRYRNIFVPSQTLISMQEMNTNAHMFPMFADLRVTLPSPRQARPSSVGTPSALRFYEALNTDPGSPIVASSAPERGYINNIMKGAFVESSEQAAAEWRSTFAGSPYRDVDTIYAATTTFSIAASTLRQTADAAYDFAYNVADSSQFTMNFGEWMVEAATGNTPLDLGPGSFIMSTDRPASYSDGSPTPFILLKNYLDDAISDFFSPAEVEVLAEGVYNRLLGYGSWGAFRTYQEILSGNEAYSEDLFFKVAKYAIAENGVRYNSPIQTYYLPNIKENRDEIRLIDTQMKYGTAFEYEITTYRLVMGSVSTIANREVGVPVTFTGTGTPLDFTPEEQEEYESTGYLWFNWWNPSTGDTTGATPASSLWFPGFGASTRLARVTVETTPSIQLIQLPYFTAALNGERSVRGSVIDDPPLAPDVAVNSYKGVNNRVVFNFNTGIGSEQQVPIPLSAPEQTYYGRLLQMNDDPAQTTILFENDDPSVRFEIMRLDYHPRVYRDFADGTKYEASTTFGVLNDERASSSAFTDTIAPNTKYYYIFRAYDVHGNVSNPSAIYEIEMIDDEGAIFPSIRTVSLLGEESRKAPTKGLTRFLQIKPQVSQALIDFSTSEMTGLTSAPVGGAEALPLGIDDVSLWGRSFKVRLTSKKTGKKIDLNLHFKKEYDDNREETLASYPPDTSSEDMA